MMPVNGRRSRPKAGKDRAAPVAERIAREIKGWIDTKRPLTNRGRPVRPNDVLISVQSRGAVFQEVIRAAASGIAHARRRSAGRFRPYCGARPAGAVRCAAQPGR
ncbi:hypothetical protein N8D56_03755 [Devosia sp. A8/3-2]|nr:hypothetical protein N8D56_03755 [Devosia sp. A8/3-2]